MSLAKPFSSRFLYLKPSDLYHTEKPYAFKVPLEDDSIPSSNIDHIEVNNIHVSDIRGREEEFSLERNGFAVFDIGDRIPYQDFHDETKVELYFNAVTSMLIDHLNASRVEVFRHAIRKRHPIWPKNTGLTYDYDQPTTTVHIDTTPEEVLNEVHTHFGDEYDELTEHRVQWINFWKPLKGPLNDWPLILCDNSTVNKEKDLEPADLLYPNRIAENCLVYQNPIHKWYYLSAQKTSEILVFLQGDTLREAPSGVPHCSVPNPLGSAAESPRESIEARCLVFYNC